jgi:hypothetical protein
MDFFTEQDFSNLKRFAGQKMLKGNKEYDDIYDRLRDCYDKVKYWSIELQKRIFPNGHTSTIRRPTNQANNFDPYLWSKIYPDQNSPDSLAFTVEINAEDKFIIKIDTVGLRSDDPRRIAYESYMGNWYSSNIVMHLPYREVYPFEWETLMNISADFIDRNFNAYRELSSIFAEIQSFDVVRVGGDEEVEKKKPLPKGSGASNYKSNLLKHPSLNNDGTQGLNNKDLLGFEKDIRSLAALIALKDLTPPLAIALFGEWGSGKSFFMHNLQQRISQLCKYQRFENLANTEIEVSEIEPFCKGVVQITFNAWSYMDVNLWAGLVSNIFEKLDHYINNANLGKEKIKEAKKILNERLLIINEEKNRVLADQQKVIEDREKLILEIQKEEQKRAKIVKDIAVNSSKELMAKVRAKVPLEEELKEELKEYGLSEALLDTLSPDKIQKEVKSWIYFFRNAFSFSIPQTIIIIVSLLVLLWVVIDPNDFIQGFFEQSKGAIIAITGILGPILFRFSKAIRQFWKLYEPVRKYKDDFNQEIENARIKSEQAIFQINEEIRQKSEALDQEDKKLAKIEEQIVNAEYDLGHSITGKAFFDFIQTKRKDDRYDKSLSIISTIRKDFETLSELFLSYNTDDNNLQELSDREIREKNKQTEKFQAIFEQKPLDRVILYIDDLDRCSEDRVVEVLEAVNLLMAYPLFVVIVGVDPRWVKNALIKKYTLQFTGVLQNRELVEKYHLEPIHVTDYLEKIFQIPFHLREGQSTDIKRFLDELLRNQIEKPTLEQRNDSSNQDDKFEEPDFDYEADGSNNSPLPGLPSYLPEDLMISKTELDNLKELSWLVGTNPRSLKRYVNIYRIIRAHENLIYSDEDQEKNFLCVIFLLGFGIGKYKKMTGDFYQNCLAEPEKTLKDIIDLSEGKDHKYNFPIERVSVTLQNFVGSDFNGYIPFVKRFSFEY